MLADLKKTNKKLFLFLFDGSKINTWRSARTRAKNKARIMDTKINIKENRATAC